MLIVTSWKYCGTRLKVVVALGGGRLLSLKVELSLTFVSMRTSRQLLLLHNESAGRCRLLCHWRVYSAILISFEHILSGGHGTSEGLQLLFESRGHLLHCIYLLVAYLLDNGRVPVILPADPVKIPLIRSTPTTARVLFHPIELLVLMNIVILSCAVLVLLKSFHSLLFYLKILYSTPHS